MIGLTEFRFLLEQGADLRGWAANRLRGALGSSLRKIACSTGARTCAGCSLDQVCPYSYCFETEAFGDSRFHSSGQETPRPYVLRTRPAQAPPRDRRAFSFQLVLIGRAGALLPYFVLAAKEWKRPGAGPGRATAALLTATALHPFDHRRHVVYDHRHSSLTTSGWHVSPDDLERSARALPAQELAVEFVTPTQLKFRGQRLRRPDFHALVSTLVRRIEALQEYHALPQIVRDGQALIAQTDAVELVEWRGRPASRERYSHRQRRAMTFEGFVGRAVYRGDLKPFLPILKLGELIHVGKGAVFGLGQMRLEA